MRASFLLLALPLVALAQSVKGPGRGPVVRVAQGQLRGARLQRGPDAPLRTLYAFRGVPYARPPVGRLRFQDPEEPEPWTGIKDATEYGPVCIQKNLASGNVSGEEDCLYLNILTADPPEDWSRVNRSVVVIIHGGAFVQWSGTMEFTRPDPLVRQGIIVVTINYRLGVFGFLNSEDAQAPGNAALKDQAQALRWVQTNIAAFGGDPAQVTLMGESAGGASVHLHLLSPYSRGLFQHAISVSGSALPAWASDQQPRRHALALRRLFARACPDAAPDAVVACLQQVEARALADGQHVPLEEYQNYFLNNTFLPSVEAPGASSAPFLTANPEQLMREGRFAQDVPYMTGYTTGDGIIFFAFARLLEEPSRWTEVDEHFADIFRWQMPPALRTREAALRMRNFYLGDRSLRDALQDTDTLQRFVLMCTDLFFAVGTVTSARMMADHNASLYVYQFSRDGPIGFTKNDLNASFIPGVVHGDDMAYVYDFSMPDAVDPLPIPASEVPIRERQAKIFGSMIKTGNPTPDGSGLERWPPFVTPQEEYMDMDQQLSVHPRALGERMAFWRQLAAEQQTGSSRRERIGRRGRKGHRG